MEVKLFDFEHEEDLEDAMTKVIMGPEKKSKVISEKERNLVAYHEGGHAVAIIGYDKEGFIIRNSWGTMYGIDGYYHLKYEDFNNSFYEIWTMV